MGLASRARKPIKRYLAELIWLRDAGYSLADLADFLRSRHYLRASREAIRLALLDRGELPGLASPAVLVFQSMRPIPVVTPKPDVNPHDRRRSELNSHLPEIQFLIARGYSRPQVCKYLGITYGFQIGHQALGDLIQRNQEA